MTTLKLVDGSENTIGFTMKNKVEDFTNFFNKVYKLVKKENVALAQKILDTAKQQKENPKSVTKKTLLELFQEVDALNLTLVQKVTAESSLKKTKTEDTETKEEPKETKKVVKKSKKVDEESANKDSKESSATETSKEEAVPNVSFKDELEVSDYGTFKLASDIKTIKQLVKALEKEENIIFAFSWTEQQLKDFTYLDDRFVQLESFENDLDIAQVMYASDKGVIAYAISMYTEAPYSIFPDDLKVKNGVRYANGIEFQVYRQIQ